MKDRANSQSTARTVLITGASAGIGKALALRLAADGARLSLIARRKEQLDEVARQARNAGAEEVLVVPCDVADRESFENAVHETARVFGAIDVLVNNAGSGHFGYVEDTPQEHLEAVFNVNVFALWYGTSAVLPQMKARGKGHIITISSFAGVFPFPADAAYVAAKHAAVGFNNALRSELAGTGVEASVVLPAGVLTDWALMTEGGPILPLFAYEGSRGAEIAAEKGIVPPDMPALLPPEEIAAQIAELMDNPRSWLFTHDGTSELVRKYRENPQAVEAQLMPLWLANREGYEKMKRGEKLS